MRSAGGSVTQSGWMARLSALPGGSLAAFLSKRRPFSSQSPPTAIPRLRDCLRPGDVLLVEGDTRISTAIKYLTQSTWSHAALFIGDYGSGRLSEPDHCFVEADLVVGVRSIGFAAFEGFHTRICRPVSLAEVEVKRLTDFAIERIGHQYDLRNVVDLARYLLPTPPIPTRWRRRMIALGSGDPTRAICSTLIAQAFQSIGYPILPVIETKALDLRGCDDCVEEIFHIRHHSLFTPRDFDVSPYFRIVKPTIESTFDHRTIRWS